MAGTKPVSTTVPITAVKMIPRAENWGQVFVWLCEAPRMQGSARHRAPYGCSALVEETGPRSFCSLLTARTLSGRGRSDFGFRSDLGSDPALPL